MTYGEFYVLVNSVTYKPGYMLSIRQDDDDRATVTLHLPRLPDARGNPWTLHLEFVRAISLMELTYYDVSFMRSWLARFICDWEEHEMAEWLKIDGQLVSEAHPERIAIGSL